MQHRNPAPAFNSRRRPLFIAALLLFLLAVPALRAEDVLFIGNSFTFVNDVPSMVEQIATSRGKTLTTMKVVKGGQGWAYHLSKPATDDALKSKPWNWVVLQDYSTNATHVPHGSQEGDFEKNGLAFYDRIAQESPGANILLYETWAYSPKHPMLAGTPVQPALFPSADAMYQEIHKSYAALQAGLQAKDAKRQVVVAPVGTAFARCAKEHPGIDLYGPDFKHPSVEGSYLAALVIYATLTHDTILQAGDVKRSNPEINKAIRQVADEVLKGGG